MSDSLNKIIGYENVKEEIREISDMLLNATERLKEGVHIPKGLIIFGEPGIGKTQLARSVASDGIKLIEVNSSDFDNKNAPRAIKNLFKKARACQPSVIFFDDIDRLCGGDAYDDTSNVRTRRNIIKNMDAMKSTDHFIVVATCNNFGCLGGAFTRAGRFDRVISMQPPREEQRREILRHAFEGISLKQDIDVEHIAKITPSFTGAKLLALANESAIEAGKTPERVITNAIVTSVIRKIIMRGKPNAEVERDFYEDEAIAVHEIGHMLAFMRIARNYLEDVTILPYGNNIGSTFGQMETREIHSEEEVFDATMINIAGHVAERVALGKYFDGCSDDIKQAIAMIKNLYIVNCHEGYYFAVADNISGYSMHEKQNTELINKVTEYLEKCDKATEKFLTDNRALLDELVKELVEKKYLAADEIGAIVKKHGIVGAVYDQKDEKKASV